jgi:alpha-L-fucosidase
MGKWMKVNGEAIYDTKASPFGIFTWGRCTQKASGKNTILYFSVFNWPADGQLVIPGLKNKVLSASLLANKAPLKTQAGNEGLVIKLPSKAIDPMATVIKVVVQGKVQNSAASATDKMKTGALD